jgi:hypothetical protein
MIKVLLATLVVSLLSAPAIAQPAAPSSSPSPLSATERAIQAVQSGGFQRPSNAQKPFTLPPIEQELSRIQKSLREAKTPEEIQSVKLYCRDTIAAYSFPKREKLMLDALTLLQQDKIAQANELLAKAHEQEEMDGHLADLTCKR